MSSRNVAHKLLIKFEKKNDRLDRLLEGNLEKNQLNAAERKLFRNIAAGVIRHQKFLDWHIDYFYRGKPSKMLQKMRVVLRMAFYELVFLEFIPERATVSEYVSLAKQVLGPRFGNQVNGILRTFIRNKDVPDPQDSIERLSVRYSFPKWLIIRWLGFWDQDEVEKLCIAFNQIPEFNIRINTSRISLNDFKHQLEKDKITWKSNFLFNDCLIISDLQALVHGGWLDKGIISVQDTSAGIPIRFLRPQKGDLVLDMCAAPGGKYTQLLEHADGQITAIAMDSDLNRMKIVKKNVHRLQIKKGIFVVADGHNLPFKNTFSKILLDVPCSGLGVIRKHPDIKWRRSPEEIREFSVLQTELLQAAIKQLAVGGFLVYSTCSIDPMENEEVIESVVKSDEFNVVLEKIPSEFHNLKDISYIKTYPHTHQMDGSFCAIVKKSRENKQLPC